MKEAILVVSFGTTHLDTLEKNITAAENVIRDASGIPCFRAFTSGIVRKRLKANQQIEVDGVAEAMQKLEQAGFERVTVQPTLLLPGEEYDKLRAEALNNAGSVSVRIGKPLLWDDDDLDALAKIMQESYPLPEDTILLGMGHGTSHAADSIYRRLRQKMNSRGMELCTVEGSIDFDAAKTSLLAQPKRRIHLVPMLLVAGDHSKNDMAGDEDDSLKSILTDAGFEVTYSLQGLGELPQVQELYRARILELMK